MTQKKINVWQMFMSIEWLHQNAIQLSTQMSFEEIVVVWRTWEFN